MREYKDDKRNFVYLTETREVEKILPDLMARKSWGTDTETTGLDPFTDSVILAQVGCREKQYLIDTRTASLDPLKPFFDSKEHKKILHYAKFDYKMLKSHSDIELEGIRCTFLTEQVIQGGRLMRGFGLEDTLKRRLNIDMDKTLQKSFIGHKGAFTLPQLIYAADDVIPLEDLLRDQCVQAQKEGVLRTVQLESDACAAFADMEYHGLIIDIPGWRKIIEENAIDQAKIKIELDRMSSQFVEEDLFGEINVNYASSQQVVYLLNKMGIKVPIKDPKTGKEVLMPVTKSDAKSLKRVNHYPFVKSLGKWRSFDTLINTFGEPWLKAIHPKTGKIHPNLDQIGTGTGRPAAGESDVNPLNVPRDNRYRHCFIGDTDEIVESDDFSGCESRILADISNDPCLIEIFQKGEDIHCAVATALYGIQVDKKGPNSKYRTPAKSLNFGKRNAKPKQNLLNSGKPHVGNPERIRWEHLKRATTHSADRTPADWV